jgi:3-dehydroquinate synthetase
MVAVAEMARQAGLFAAEDVVRQNSLLAALGLPTVYHGSVRAGDILKAIQLDKKVANKRVRWVIPRRIGEVEVMSMPDELVQQVITKFFNAESA